MPVEKILSQLGVQRRIVNQPIRKTFTRFTTFFLSSDIAK